MTHYFWAIFGIGWVSFLLGFLVAGLLLSNHSKKLEEERDALKLLLKQWQDFRRDYGHGKEPIAYPLSTMSDDMRVIDQENDQMRSILRTNSK